MRPDFGRCITERPRTKGLGKITRKGYKKRLLKEGLDCVSRESITKQHSYDKEFTDVLGPIVGFLTKSVGRPWSKVCSEISASLPASGGVSYSHARDHLFQMVEEHTQVIDGQVYDSKGFKLSESRRWKQFYVDQHGILRIIKQTWKRFKERKPKVYPKTEAGEWLAEDSKGIWWAYEMKPYVKTGVKLHPDARMQKHRFTQEIWPIAWDEMQRSYITDHWTAKRLYGESVYASSRRQLGKREIKKYRLREQ